MRNLIKNYNIAGTHEIAILGEQPFNAQDVRLIINETQKVPLVSSMRKDMIVLVQNNVITINPSLPPLQENDILTIEIDSLANAEGLQKEINVGKGLIANSLTLQGQNATYEDTFTQLSEKVLAVTGDITVSPIAQPYDYNLYTNVIERAVWHDMAYEIAQWNDVTMPYVVGVMLTPNTTQIFLSGGKKYKTSDGVIHTIDNTVTIGVNEAGRTTQVTKYVIIRSNTPFMSLNFGNWPNISLVRKVIMVYNKNCDFSAMNFANAAIPYITIDEVLTNPIIFSSTRKELVFQIDQFRGNSFYTFQFPRFADDATEAEKVLNISGTQAFNACIALSSLIFPQGLQNLMISGISAFNACIALSFIYISKPSLIFNGFSSNAFASAQTQPMKIELENRWNYSINLSSGIPPNLSAPEVEEFIIDRLLDLRSTAQEDVSVNIASGALTTWNAVKSDDSPLVGHANFQEIFRVDQVVIVNIAGTNRSYTIASIPSNNQMIMTASTSMVAGTYVLNYNKVVTFGATNLNKLSAAQQLKATTKKWQLA